MGEVAGMNIISVYDQISIVHIAVVVIGVFFALLAIVSLMRGCEQDEGDYFVLSALLATVVIVLMMIGLPNIHQRGFKAKVETVSAWAEISINYSMVDLDENGVFTFKER